jgi:hypothetical protein
LIPSPAKSAASETEVVGFVVDSEPNRKAEIEERVREIELLHGVKVYLQGFEEWVKSQVQRASVADTTELGKQWVLAFSESLCQLRRDLAPIDEPSDAWVTALIEHANRCQTERGKA